METPRNSGRTFRVLALSALPLWLLACGQADDPSGETTSDEEPTIAAAGQPVELPFALDETSPDLLLTYADATGAHTVHRPSEVPEAAREWVRVDSLSLAPEQRPADGQVYVVDLRDRPADSRAARLVPRATFDAHVERASGTAGRGGGGGPVVAGGSGDIVLYGASWCGACRQARQFFEREGIAFIDRDIERDPGARDEMNQKARAAGVPTTGIPVIDVRGTILPGFDERRIRQLLGTSAGGGARPSPAAQPI